MHNPSFLLNFISFTPRGRCAASSSQADIAQKIVSLTCSDHLLAVPVSTDRLPLHAARGAAVVTVSRPVRMRHHGSPRTICGIEGCTAPAGSLNRTPSSLAGEDSVVEAIERAWTGAVDERSVAHERDVVETEVPDGSIGHAVGAESHQSADDRSGENVVLKVCQ